MAEILTHYVQMETFIVPDEVARKGNNAVEQYISDHDLEPIGSDTRDWEIVDIDLDS